jgi:hypothetical protein
VRKGQQLCAGDVGMANRQWEFRFWVLGFGFWVLGCGLWAMWGFRGFWECAARLAFCGEECKLSIDGGGDAEGEYVGAIDERGRTRPAVSQRGS